MAKTSVYLLLILLLACCSAPPKRDCANFKEGEFSFSTLVNGVEKKTIFQRKEGIEIDVFEGKTDTSSVRWINDCEYVLKNLNPKNKAEEKSIHIKILKTTDSSYTFEYNAIGDTRKFKGTAFKTN